MSELIITSSAYIINGDSPMTSVAYTVAITTLAVHTLQPLIFCTPAPPVPGQPFPRSILARMVGQGPLDTCHGSTHARGTRTYAARDPKSSKHGQANMRRRRNRSARSPRRINDEQRRAVHRGRPLALDAEHLRC